MQVTRSHWGRTVKRFAEAFGAFLWFSLVCMLILKFGVEHLYEWSHIKEWPSHSNKASWLQENFWWGRQIVWVAVMIFVGQMFLKYSNRPDMGLAHEKHPNLWKSVPGWRGAATEIEDCQAKQSTWAVLYCIAFAVCVSMLSYDLVMSLDFRWFSAMFGGWNFTTALLTGWASMVLISWFMSERFEVAKYLSKPVYHDLGKLTFGFTIVWAYLLFAQWLVIWYGNLPHEAGFLLTRFQDPIWKPWAILVFCSVFLVPFILGLSKHLKLSPKTFAPIAVLSLCGVWLERFILIAPSAWYFNRKEGVYWDQNPFVKGSEDIAGAAADSAMNIILVNGVVGLGFLGVFGLMYTLYLYKRPIMVISDPRLDMGVNRH
ncbi:hypothetical protein [Acanthopleuribacter pedis]|uniref:Uncharacterized protein n=1 Tax=Acanthopleuribacter pedis TaxID=442870 RepID=A0A8J7U4A7_9BACT|nr:hypothetical protein [Acanthopleuribacter pedis]MBO1320447.1 hypothetical protein [Acanthopleuribacter pedis]